MPRLLDWSRRTSAAGKPPRPRNACCSFCRRSPTDMGPLAEGPGLVFICGECAAVCG